MRISDWSSDVCSSDLQTLGRAAEEDNTQHFLQRPNLLANGSGRDRQFISGACEAQMARGGIQHAQAIQRQMGALHSVTAGAIRETRGIWASNVSPLDRKSTRLNSSH